MRRDKALVYEILNRIATGEFHVDDEIEGYTSGQVSYHLWLLKSAGYLSYGFRDDPSLTWQGNELLDELTDADRASKSLGLY